MPDPGAESQPSAHMRARAGETVEPAAEDSPNYTPPVEVVSDAELAEKAAQEQAEADEA